MLKRIVSIVVSMLLLSVWAASPAHAAPTVGGSTAFDICSGYSNLGWDTGVGQGRDPLSLLPAKRWGGTVPNHSRLPLSFDPGTWFGQAQSQTVGVGMVVGNAAWQASTSVTEGADRFCLGERIGHVIDQVTATAGEAVLNSGLATALVIGVLVVTLVRSRRGGGLVATLGRMALSLIVIAVLISGASATVVGGGFGKGSPGWWGKMISDTVSTVAAAPVGALSDAASAITESTANQGSNAGKDVLHCDNYVGMLEVDYRGSYDRWNAARPVSVDAMNSMWKSSGLETWKRVQFGDNKFADKAGCRLLELSAGVAATNHVSRTSWMGQSDGSRLSVNAGLNPAALPFSAMTNDEVDQAMVAWAACTLSPGGQFGVAEEWKGIDNPISAEDCKNAFTTPMADFNPSGSVFNFGDNVSDNVARTVNSPEVQDYILGLHGNRSQGMMGVIVVYALASWVTTAVFAVLAGAVIIAKVGVLLLTLFAMWMLLAGLVRVNSEGSKVGELAKHFITMVFFSFAASLLLAVTAMVTAVIHQAGSAVTGGEALSSALWCALAPVAAVLLIHLMFTKLLKAPSPFSLTGGMAWGAAAAGGNAVMNGSGLKRAMNTNAMTRGARNIGRKIAAGSGKSAGGSRKGGISPVAGLGLMGAGKAIDDVFFDAPRERKAAKERAAAETAAAGKPATGKRAAADPAEAAKEAIWNMSPKDADDAHWAAVEQRRINFVDKAGAMQPGRRLSDRVPATGGMGIAGSLLATPAGEKLWHGAARAKDATRNAVRFAADHPFRAARKAAGAGLVAMGVVAAGPVGAVAAVGGAAAIKAMRKRSEYRAQHNGMTKRQYEAIKDERSAWLKRQRAAATAPAPAASPKPGSSAAAKPAIRISTPKIPAKVLANVVNRRPPAESEVAPQMVAG